ncbi:MAG: ion transporter [Hyphomicrobiales bacterium]|nr:ion transporter [Hyphomicrobiales bacterium]
MKIAAAPGSLRANVVAFLSELYEGDTQRGRRFRYGLLAFDIATVVFIIGTSFIQRNLVIEALDFVIGFAVLADFLSRMIISQHRMRDLAHPTTWADIIAIASFLAPLSSEGAGFLRILRTVRLLKAYHLLARLREDLPVFRRNEEVIIAIVHLVVFIFVMTGIVYESQHYRNPGIANYVDALYFTVTTLTTTGFGDITLSGTPGRLISVVVMIAGVTLFLRLAQVLFRPTKVRFDCPQCGLQRHDPDAVHCKACGIILNIPDEGI